MTIYWTNNININLHFTKWIFSHTEKRLFVKGL